MTKLSDDLIARIKQRALDPKRRHMTAADDERAVLMPTNDIAQKIEDRSGEAGDVFRQMQARMASMGFAILTMSFVEHPDGMNASSQPPDARPLAPQPSDGDWAALEAIARAPIPADLGQVYAIADGGFGPGFRSPLGQVDRTSTPAGSYRASGLGE